MKSPNLKAMIFSSFILLIACKKFVEVSPPITQLVTKSVFGNSVTATSALTNIYQQMYKNQESYNIALQTGLLGDELTNYSTSVTQFKQYYTNSMAASSTFGPWTNAFNYIYQANTIIEGVHNNSAIAPIIANQLTGESKFIRAFWYFYLVNCYSDVPLVASTNYVVNALMTRAPKAIVYKQIITDLNDAQNLLNSNYVDASDTVVTTERIRPTKWAAMALLARVYLYTGDYTNAEIQATGVINNSSMFSLVGNLDSVFLKNSPEAIWQLGIPLPNSYNTLDAQSFILKGAPNISAISPLLISTFEIGDNRKTKWIQSYSTTAPINVFYYPYKYKIYNISAITEYTMILRLAEQYLIRSEARAKGAGIGLTGAISDLNVIRNRSGLPNYSGLTDLNSILAAILHERQVELFTEWGNRWFDLIRTQNVNSVMGMPGKVCENKGGIWDPNWQFFPIPQTERNADPNLTQNEGY